MGPLFKLDASSLLYGLVEGLVRRWYLIVPVLLVLLGVLVPLLYLVIRACQADPGTLYELVVRPRVGILLFNTVSLTFGVLICTTLVSFPLAWLTVRANLIGNRFYTILGVLPLAIPGYVMAYVLLATTGTNGTLARFMNLYLPRLNGYDGALIALTVTTFPYLYLNLRTSLKDVDLRLEESALSLGTDRWTIFWDVIVPQLRPGYLAGSLLVSLHVLGDFGVVSLMRFETFSYALYLQYTASYDRIYASWLAIILLALTIGLLVVEAFLLRGLLLHSDQREEKSERTFINLGFPNWYGYIFCGMLAFFSVILPIFTIAEWMSASSFQQVSFGDLGFALWNSLSASVPAALLATALAVPIAYVGTRYQSFWAVGVERISYLGYATPRLAFALALIVFVLGVVPVMYQTLALLVVAYALHFLAEAIGPIRSRLYRTSENVEEAARSLGSPPWKNFMSVILPLVSPGLLVSTAFVFLSSMKELPLTLLLAPVGFHTLATNTWGYAEEAMFAQAAPYALTIIVFSSCFVFVLLTEE